MVDNQCVAAVFIILLEKDSDKDTPQRVLSWWEYIVFPK